MREERIRSDRSRQGVDLLTSKEHFWCTIMHSSLGILGHPLRGRTIGCPLFIASLSYFG